MKHAGPAALDALEPLLKRLRALGRLREPRPGVFYLRSRAFLHFHEDPTGLFADLRLPGEADFERLAVGDEQDREILLARVSAAVSA